MVKEGLKNVTAGANPMDLKRGVDKAVEAVVNELNKKSETVGNSSEKIKQIASISANNDENIGETIVNHPKPLVLFDEIIIGIAPMNIPAHNMISPK